MQAPIDKAMPVKGPGLIALQSGAPRTVCSGFAKVHTCLAVTYKDVKEMIDHSDISMTDRYTHITVQRMMERREKLALHYSEGFSN